MKRISEESLGDVLRRAIEEQNMTGHLREMEAARLWPAIVGPGVAGCCGKPFCRNGVLTVAVRSAALRQDLVMSRSSQIFHLNKALGGDVVKDIRFIG